MVPEPALVERFRKNLDALIGPEARIGVAVSGGPTASRYCCSPPPLGRA